MPSLFLQSLPAALFVPASILILDHLGSLLTFLATQTPSPKPTKTQERPSSRRITYTFVFSVSSLSHFQHMLARHRPRATPPVEISLLTRFTHQSAMAVSYTHLRAHETRHDLVCRL